MASAMVPGLILLGNSGVGKSFLANQLLDDDKAFESRFSARSVTRHTEWKDMQTPIGKYTYRIANIPGLVEADQKLIDENRTEIMEAFENCPFSIVLFIFGHKNGRIPDEDLVAFMRITDAYEISPDSLILVVNGMPFDCPDDYEDKTARLLSQLTHVDEKRILFIEKTTSNDNEKVIRRVLLDAVAKCQPTHHAKKHDIELLTDEILRLKNESKQRQDALLAQKQDYENKKKLDSTTNTIQDLSKRARKESLTTVIEPISQFNESTKQFEEPMKNNEIQSQQYVPEYKKQLSNSYINDTQLIHEVEKTTELSRQLIAEEPSQSQNINVAKQKKQIPLKRVLDTVAGVLYMVGDALGGGRTHNSHDAQEPLHNIDELQPNCPPSSSPSSNSHDQNSSK